MTDIRTPEDERPELAGDADGWRRVQRSGSALDSLVFGLLGVMVVVLSIATVVLCMTEATR